MSERDWSKIRDYFDCLGDTEEEKKLRIRWVREMKAENAELRAKLAATRCTMMNVAVSKLRAALARPAQTQEDDRGATGDTGRLAWTPKPDTGASVPSAPKRDQK